MLKDILPKEILDNLRYKLEDVCELRLRKDKNIVISVMGKYVDAGIRCLPTWIDEIVLRASRFSIYTVNEQLKAGFIAVKGGVRIGVCGEVVPDGQVIKTIKNITSLNIRNPREAIGCSDPVAERCFNGRLNSTLVISKPGAGKTTHIRDLCRSLSRKNLNVLVLDERGEISGEAEGRFQFDVGSSDVMLYCSKQFGFSFGVRAMRPDVIICDELKGEEDCGAVYEALSCGVCVVATIHSGGVEELMQKRSFKGIIESGAFKRYVLLSDEPRPGSIKAIFDEKLETIL
jgi:stage III sporulation protein AA